MNKKAAFLTSVALTAFMGLGPAYAKPPSSIDNLKGTWVNVNPNSKGVAKIIISEDTSVSPTAYGIQVYVYCGQAFPCQTYSNGVYPISSGYKDSSGQGFYTDYQYTDYATNMNVYSKVFGEFKHSYDTKVIELNSTLFYTDPADTRIDSTRIDFLEKTK